MANTIGSRLRYLFAYKFRNLFFVLTIFLIIGAFADSLIYLLFALITLALGIFSHTLRNKAINEIRS